MIFEYLTGLLPASLQPFAKAIYPALSTVIAVVVEWISTGVYNQMELTTSIAGLASAVLVYLIPNRNAAPTTSNRWRIED